MKKKFNLLFSFALLLVMLSAVKVEAKDVIINVSRDSVTNHPIITHTITGVNPTNTGTDAEQEAAYTLAYTDTNMTIQLLNADDTYYINLNSAVHTSINDSIGAGIKYLHANERVTLEANETIIPELSNVEVGILTLMGFESINNATIVARDVTVHHVSSFVNSNITTTHQFSTVDVPINFVNSIVETLYFSGSADTTLTDSIIKISSPATQHVAKLAMTGKSKVDAEVTEPSITTGPLAVLGLDMTEYYAFDENNNRLVYDSTSYIFKNPTTNEVAKHIFIYPKATVTFKIENGTWADGTTDPIIIETHAFANLDNSLVPTGMKANEGYTDGAWDKNIVYNELGGDYTYVYSYSPYAVVDNEECPKTGENTLMYAIVLLGSTCGIIGVREYKKRLG